MIVKAFPHGAKLGDADGLTLELGLALGDGDGETLGESDGETLAEGE